MTLNRSEPAGVTTSVESFPGTSAAYAPCPVKRYDALALVERLASQRQQKLAERNLTPDQSRRSTSLLLKSMGENVVLFVFAGSKEVDRFARTTREAASRRVFVFPAAALLLLALRSA